MVTIGLQVALPEDLAHRIEAGAEQRGLAAGDFLTLLLGLFTLPQMRLSEDPVVRDLSDELMLHFQRRAAAIERESGKALDLLPSSNDYRVPQSLSELKPRVQPPPGKTIRDMLPKEPWPGDETDEELLAALKAMG